ncbi:MAG TPA: DUF1015 domain-containing protein [Bacteroidetes bacterium]|nr:DUF1015 domain-containing protein [Bacteroidota bacterium]
MSTFVPFKAFRPVREKAKDVACRPYDVLDEKEARKECEGNPLSFYHVIKPEIDFPDGHDHYAPEIYQKGKENFDKLVKSNVLFQDAEASFYVYQLNMDGHKQTSLVGCCAIDDYFNGVIKKHEKTRPDKEEDRKNHIRASKLNYEPVFFSYPKVDAIDRLVEQAKTGKPEYDFTSDDGVRHTAWVIKDRAMVAAVEKLFETSVPKIYVADGHHRTAAGAHVAQEFRAARGGDASDGHRDNYFMAALFPDDQVKIFDYNRVVKDLNGLSSGQFVKLLSNSFFIEEKSETYRSESPHVFGMYLDGKWYKLTAKNGTYNGNPIGRLDVTILSKHLLEPILDIVDLRTDKRIEFVGGIRGIKELEKRVDSGEMKVAFSMFPVSMKEVIEVSDNGELMPPKVTWFEPKLRSGLFVHSLNGK